MSDQPPNRPYGQQPEKQEKQEKQEEKDEKERHEKVEEEKWRRDPLSGMAWALILIWAGLVLLAETNGVAIPFLRINTWGLIFTGAGLILLLEVALRLVMPAYRRPVAGSIIIAVILLGIGLGDLINWNIIWPLILIGIGLAILLRGGPRPR